MKEAAVDPRGSRKKCAPHTSLSQQGLNRVAPHRQSKPRYQGDPYGEVMKVSGGQLLESLLGDLPRFGRKEKKSGISAEKVWLRN